MHPRSIRRLGAVASLGATLLAVSALAARPTMTTIINPNPLLEGSQTEVSVRITGTLTQEASRACQAEVQLEADTAEKDDFQIQGEAGLEFPAGTNTVGGYVRVDALQDDDLDDETVTVKVELLCSSAFPVDKDEVPVAPADKTLTIEDDDEGTP